MKPSWIIACIAHTDDEISLHIINAPTWQEALNQSPAVWWHTPPEMDIDQAQKLAWSTYLCHIAVKPL